MARAPVLLVEGDPEQAALVRRALDEAGIAGELVVAPDGEAALALLEHADPLPAVVLLDLRLAGALDGLDVLDAIRRRPETALLPVAMLTGSSEPEDIAAAYGHGATNFFVKPPAFPQLVARVRELFGWLALVRAAQ